VSWARVDGDDLPFGLADLANEYTALGYSVGYAFEDERRGTPRSRSCSPTRPVHSISTLAMTVMKRGERSNIAAEAASRYPEGG